MDKEKQVRIRIDGKVNQMIAEAAELKQWTITEVRPFTVPGPVLTFGATAPVVSSQGQAGVVCAVYASNCTSACGAVYLLWVGTETGHSERLFHKCHYLHISCSVCVPSTASFFYCGLSARGLVAQIEAIRSEMDIEVNRLIAIIHKKNVDLTDLETKLVNRLRWGIVVLQSKNENLIRRQVLQWWRYA